MTDNNLSIVNLVASGRLEIGEIDTRQLAEDIEVSDVVLQPNRIYIKPRNHPTITIYRSGKFSIAGAESLAEVENSTEWLIEVLQNIGINILQSDVVESITVKFMVLQADLKQKIDLEEATQILSSGHTEYEPEQFPAVIYQPKDTDCTATIFSTGKISITGIRRKEDAEVIYDQLRTSLTE